MPKPDTEGRFEILNLHLKNKKVCMLPGMMLPGMMLPGIVPGAAVV
jgi:hypothetical protein